MALYELCSSYNGQAKQNASTTIYAPFCGFVKSGYQTVETYAQHVARSSYTLANLFSRVIENTDSQATLRSRKNAANGNMSVTITVGGSGVFQDTTNTDSLVAGDTFNISSTSGVTSGPRYYVFGATLAPVSGSVTIYAIGGFTTIASNGTLYEHINGAVANGNATENNISLTFRTTATLANLRAFLSANSLNAGATFVYRTRVNQVNGSQVITFTSTDSGALEDTTNTDAIVSGDTANLSQVMAGRTSGSVDLRSTGLQSSSTRRFFISTGSGGTFSADFYHPIEGAVGNVGTQVELDQGYNLRSTTVTFNQLFVRVLTHGATNGVTIRERKNGANGAMTVTFSANTTGTQEDTTNTESPVSGDRINIFVDHGGGAGSISFAVIALGYDSGFVAITGASFTVTFTSTSTAVVTPIADIDWAKDGVPDDITADIRRVTWTRGRDREQGNTPGGTMEIEVSDPNGDYSPENSGTRFGSKNVIPGRPIRYRETYGGTVYEQFSGRVEKVVPRVSAHDRSAYIYCTDGFDYLDHAMVELPSDNSPPWDGVPLRLTPIGYSVGAVGMVLDAALWPTARRTIDEFVGIVDWWFVHDKSALQALYELEAESLGFMYVDGSGNLVFESRAHRDSSDHLTSQATFTNSMVEVEYELSARNVANRIEVLCHKKDYKRDPATGTEVTEVLGSVKDNIFIPSGKVRYFRVNLSAPVGILKPPVSGEDWAFNTKVDGSGTDRTSSVSYSVTLYGQQVLFTFENTSTDGVYMIAGTSATGEDATRTLLVWGTPLEGFETVAVAEDQLSQAKFGIRTRRYVLKFSLDTDTGQFLAEDLLGRLKEPTPDFVKITLVNADSTLTTQILSRKLSDRITLTVGKLSITSVDYYINKMVHVREPQFASVTWWLERVGRGLDVTTGLFTVGDALTARGSKAIG